MVMPPDEKPKRDRNARIMYIESKAEGLVGPARIGRVTSSRTFTTLYYRGLTFQRLKSGFKANYFDVETRDEYWTSIRKQPERAASTTTR